MTILENHFRPLPAGLGLEPVRSAKFMDVEVWGHIFAESGTIGGDVTIEGTVTVADIVSDDWDGGSDLSGGKDGTATLGYFLDDSAGAAQFQEIYAVGGEIDELDITGLLTMVSGAQIQTGDVDAGDAGIVVDYWDGVSANFPLQVYTGHSDEFQYGGIYTNVVGNQGSMTIQGPTIDLPISPFDYGFGSLTFGVSPADDYGYVTLQNFVDEDMTSTVNVIADGNTSDYTLARLAARNSGSGPARVELESEDGVFLDGGDLYWGSGLTGSVNAEIAYFGVDQLLRVGEFTTGRSSHPTAAGANAGGIVLGATDMNTSSRYTNGIYFASDDSAFTTVSDGKILASIMGQALETYTANNDGYMGITFHTSPANPGTNHSLTETWMMHSATSQAILTPLGEGTNTSLSYNTSSNQWKLRIDGTDEMILGTTGFVVPNAYNNTTGSAANVHISVGSGGTFQRSTSSKKYKNRITYNVDYLADLVLKPTKHWRIDDKEWRYGLILEDLVAVDPLLADGESPDWNAIVAVLIAKINRLEGMLGVA